MLESAAYVSTQREVSQLVNSAHFICKASLAAQKMIADSTICLFSSKCDVRFAGDRAAGPSRNYAVWQTARQFLSAVFG
jgi:hypothetical protein